MIGPRVARHATLRAGRHRRLFRVVGTRPDQHRLRPGNGAPWIRRSLRVLVGELQPVVQPGLFPADELSAGPLEHVGVADTDVGYVVLLGDVDELPQVCDIS